MNDFDRYQNECEKLAIYPRANNQGITYTALKLNGEAGEVAEKIGKCIRDNNGEFTLEIKHSIAMELGDVLWYVAMLANEIGYDLSKISDLNLEKLYSRKSRNVLSGSGDNR